MATTIKKSQALAIFAAIGLKSAGKWADDRLAAKLAELPDLVDDGTEMDDPDLEAALTTVLEAVEAGEPIGIQPDKPKPAGKAAAKKPAAKKPAAAAKKPAAKKPAAKKPAAAAKKPAAKKPEADSAPKKRMGVRVDSTDGRPYHAGRIIARYGLSAGITQEMADELDTLCGATNNQESWFALRNAFHAVRGYLDNKGKTQAAAKVFGYEAPAVDAKVEG